MMAAAHHDLRDVAALLLGLGMSPDVNDREHRPLHAAASSDSPSVATLLIQRGAEIDAKGHIFIVASWCLAQASALLRQQSPSRRLWL
jgi:hypothetical protein